MSCTADRKRGKEKILMGINTPRDEVYRPRSHRKIADVAAILFQFGRPQVPVCKWRICIES